MDTERKCIKMVTVTKVIGLMGKNMEMENILIRMDQNSKDSMKMAKDMETGKKTFEMVILMKGVFKMDVDQDRVHLFGRMEKNMKDSL